MQKKKKAFTLIELMIVISIIGILTIGMSQINFRTISDKQKAENYFTKTKSVIETVKNNSLIGRGIGTELSVPEKWSIDFRSGTGSTGITTSYYSGSWIKYDDYSYSFKDNFSIKNIQCLKLDNSSSSLNGNTGSIIISGPTLSLSGCTDNTYKILQITTAYKNFQNTFKLNTISGVIEDL